ncbi:hypothetical protein PUV54_04970 [Hyphococcus flavus]|uniref:Uncharacterized protein n=1 Tax=Hyphococcus flavus TaxID=1866326 RepID=A0AAF0CC45_9PROT|nr:hypothetical protein [Hyphococcus flavus]WDI32545.1 hypothetical protein PUV54_04970 [Hyphococcus flavus]
MEQESSASKSKRRARVLRRSATEVFFAMLFVAAVLIGDRSASGQDAALYMKILAVGLPLLVVTVWWLFYAKLITSLGEFERAMATRSLAISCGVTLWVTTAWGLAIEFAGAPGLSLALIAPLAAIIYSVTRAIFHFVYR